MPLSSGTSKETISKNIAQLRSENYPEKQAAAIAYREARGDMDGPQFKKLTGLLDEFFSEEAKEPEHKKADAADRFDFEKVSATEWRITKNGEKYGPPVNSEAAAKTVVARLSKAAKVDAALKKADALSAKAPFK